MAQIDLLKELLHDTNLALLNNKINLQFVEGHRIKNQLSINGNPQAEQQILNGMAQLKGLINELEQKQNIIATMIAEELNKESQIDKA